MYQVNRDFFYSSRDYDALCKYLSGGEMVEGNYMQSIYLKSALIALSDAFIADLEKSYSCRNLSFSRESTQNLILFVVYLSYLLIVYVVFWIGLMANTQNELWVSKSILSVLSPEFILSMPRAKEFILRNSSVVLISKSVQA